MSLAANVYVNERVAIVSILFPMIVSEDAESGMSTLLTLNHHYTFDVPAPEERVNIMEGIIS